MRATIKRYVKERDEMLQKCSVEALEEFAKSHAQFFPKGFTEMFASASYGVKEATLHKMIVSAVNLPADLRKASAIWLTSRGFSLW